MAVPDIPSVEFMTSRLRELLDRAQLLKRTTAIEPPLPVAEFGPENGLHSGKDRGSLQGHNAVVETAARNLMYSILATTNIDDVAFVQVWNLLDILQICGDRGECDPALVFWLVEELLDSQSIDGCRKIFDYLDSRRERLVAKDFLKNKNLVVLRSCNELLRRLSRAEDAVFCGRVFIFLFQCFPLGDRSSVNLRGEFHVENVTSFEDTVSPEGDAGSSMDIDAVASGTDTVPENTQATGKNGSVDPNNGDTVLDSDALYPLFWKLQQAFSNPPKLFSQDSFQEFKHGLQATIAKFKHVPKVLQARSNGEAKRGLKRKHDEEDEDFASTFNPKYLTSRDLFKLELSDLAFQRHILVQALILIDFLLSLTEKSKKKLGELNAQKALQYSFVLSEQDAEWATGMRNTIAGYLQEGPDGKFYYRMVDTVLSRDKNWVRWKMEACPPISRPSVSQEELDQAKSSAVKASANKRLRGAPLGSLDLSFLSEGDSGSGLDSLKDPERYSVPTPETVMKAIEGDELDMQMAKEEDQEALRDAKASKAWRLLRVCSKTRLSLFDKIEDGKQLQNLFQPEMTEEREGITDGHDGRIADSSAEKLSASEQGELVPDQGVTTKDGVVT